MAKAVLLTFIAAALRRTELLALRVPDVRLEAGQLLVARGNGSGCRVAASSNASSSSSATSSRWAASFFGNRTSRNGHFSTAP